MKKLDRVLEDCLERAAKGESLEQCLLHYPQFADELRPLLQTAAQLECADEVHPSEEFEKYGRAQLISYMSAHPRKRTVSQTLRSPRGSAHGLKPIWRLAVSFAVVVVAFFVTGTALAQSALPGQPLYGWKLTSEAAWRALSPNPVTTDLTLTKRRTQEALSVSGREQETALQGLGEVLTRLASEEETDPSVKSLIVPVLTTARDDLEESGIQVPELDEYLSRSNLIPVPGMDESTDGPLEEALSTPTGESSQGSNEEGLLGVPSLGVDLELPEP